MEDIRVKLEKLMSTQPTVSQTKVNEVAKQVLAPKVVKKPTTNQESSSSQPAKTPKFEVFKTSTTKSGGKSKKKNSDEFDHEAFQKEREEQIIGAALMAMQSIAQTATIQPTVQPPVFEHIVVQPRLETARVEETSSKQTTSVINPMNKSVVFNNLTNRAIGAKGSEIGLDNAIGAKGLEIGLDNLLKGKING